MLVGAVLAPQRADDAKLGEGRVAPEHGNEALVFFRREPVLADERGRDDRIAGARFDGFQTLGHCGASGFFGDTGVFSSPVLEPFRASASLIMCGELLVPEYLRAADSHALDYRLLPAISLVESTCGAFEKMNNRWGWDSVQSGFPSVPAGIEFITAQLAESPSYKGKTVKQKLFTYNPYKAYVRQVERLMQQIED